MTFNFGSPTPSNFEQWVISALQQIENSSVQGVETVVDDFDEPAGFTETRTLGASPGTAPGDSSGGTPAVDLAAVTLPTLAWNGVLAPTAAEATAIISALTAMRNNLSTLAAAYASSTAESATLRNAVATLISDIQKRGQKRND